MSYTDIVQALRQADFFTRSAAEGTKRLEDQRAALEARVEELQALLAGVPTPVPPAVPGVPVPVPPAAGPDDPDFSQLPFADLMPAWTPYKIPTEEDCDWIVEGPRARHCESGHEIQASPSWDGDYAVAGDAYRWSASRGDLDGPLVFGIKGNGGRAMVCTGGDPSESQSLSRPWADKYATVRAQFVGLTDDAEVVLGWSNRYGYAAEVSAFNIGLRGGKHAMVIQANEACGNITLDGCWLLSREGTYHEHGIHMDEWERLVLRRMKSKGFKAQQHSLLYGKSSRGQTWVVDCELQGGGRTGVQIRPGRDDAGNPRPVGPVVIAQNRSHEFGWDRDQLDGGGVISVYSSPDAPVFILGNYIRDPRGAGIVVNGQSAARNWLNAAGFPIADVYLADNMVTGQRSDRAQVAIGGAQRVHWHASNQVDMRVSLDDQWGIETHGIRNGEVRFYGNPRTLAPQLRTWTGADRAMTDEEIEQRMAQAAEVL